MKKALAKFLIFLKIICSSIYRDICAFNLFQKIVVVLLVYIVLLVFEAKNFAEDASYAADSASSEASEAHSSASRAAEYCAQ